MLKVEKEKIMQRIYVIRLCVHVDERKQLIIQVGLQQRLYIIK